MKEIIDLKEENFEENTKKGKWIIDFWAVWCGPCRMMKAEFEKAAQELGKEINFAKVNIDENYNLAERFEIRAVPSVFFLKDGEVVNASVGYLTKEQIVELAEETFG